MDKIRLIKQIFEKVNFEIKDSNQWVDRGYETLEPPRIVPSIHHWIDKYFRDIQYRIKDLEKDFLSKFGNADKGESKNIHNEDGKGFNKLM